VKLEVVRLHACTLARLNASFFGLPYPALHLQGTIVKCKEMQHKTCPSCTATSRRSPSQPSQSAVHGCLEAHVAQSPILCQPRFSQTHSIRHKSSIPNSDLPQPSS
jgi:hypothetical protein